ncbi:MULTISPECIES: cation diffusion facilitator family transporter [Thermoactinomyces]|uniref:Cation transporter n=1 Tax=Thermoactinomyces daqus TaxID=1329516 RepID=A0A7W2AHB0_9BACL|nr:MULTISPECIES: cation diffusion facilitator family transporter [Thermoactinomyces]MBA4541663.1 cation transporter [Thermoactinomyces daqus]MBH8597661.1 cation transporter [Thermoactinomyces sp. CICC 10523]
MHVHTHGDHDHGHLHHRHQRADNKKGLLIALLITVGIMLLEFFGGLFTHSLALLSDSGHMLSDAATLFLSFAALWFAVRPPSPRKTYGYYRFEILAALFNGVLLFIISGWIIWEAVLRFFHPARVSSGPMILIAAVGLVANLLSAWALLSKGDVKGNVNLRSAYLHVLGDALGSLGAIAAGVLIYLFSWYYADPLISILVAVLILKGAWGVISHSLHILMEGTPVTVDCDEVDKILRSIPGVINVHDLHVWTITSELDSLSCHLLVEEQFDQQQILQQAIRLIAEHFQIHHTTIQVETEQLQHPELH